MENMAKTWPNRSFATTWPPRHLLPTSPSPAGLRPRTSHGHKLEPLSPLPASVSRPFTVAATQAHPAHEGDAAARPARHRTDRSGLAAAAAAERMSETGTSALLGPSDRFDRLRYWADLTAVHPFYLSHRREGVPPRRV